MEKVIIDPKDSNDYITGIRGFVDANNKLTLSWVYPENSQYHICVVYEVKDGEETLEELITQSQAGIYDLDFGSKHVAAMSEGALRYKLFPAYKRENRLYIGNQKRGNDSGRFLKRVKLLYQVEERRRKLLEKYKTVSVRVFGAKEANVTELYYKIAGSPYELSYAIDLSKFLDGEGCSILLRPEETISFFVSDDQKSYIDLVRKNS